ncbi:synapse differentiation-inducing gene protein 1-like [Labeo rohita]|uniref:Synapse differentiation-inducing gene protein 1-like n=1 Tax=Labeo rohita TaxID=84645 RepID=A0A498L572_LABRO|nr:synapse differentiation-inducing gene protein 1-like [Labeo rohita]
MDSRKSRKEWNSSQNPKTGQPLLPLQQDPPAYSGSGFSPSHNYPSSSQQYGAPATSGLCTEGSYPTRDANMFGHQHIASRNSRMARILNHVSVAIGLFFGLIFAVYFIFVIMAVKHIRNFGL